MRGAHLVQVLDQEDEVLPVLGLAAPLARVFPVQVQAVKLVAADEGEGGAGKGAPGGRVRSHLGILLTALIPAPDSQGHLDKNTDCLYHIRTQLTFRWGCVYFKLVVFLKPLSPS